MIPCQIEKPMPFAAVPARPSRFRSACTVMANTIVNRTYNLESASLKTRAEQAHKEYPKLSKWTEFGSRYTFWLGMAVLERCISRHTGPTVSCGLVYSNPFVVSAVAKYAKKPDAGKPKGISTLLSKPDISTYSGTFAIMELATIPAYVFVADRIARFFSDAVVTPLVAAAAILVGNLAAMAIEYLSFRYIWKKRVLKDMPQGNIRDEWNGFVGEFKPLKLFSGNQVKEPAKTASGFIGELWGTIERHFVWVQMSRLAFVTAFTALFAVPAKTFIDSLFTAMAACGFGLVMGAVTAKYFQSVSDKIEANAPKPENEK
ncbi:MAG: hypothetical protein V1827_04075 [Candidatus Micrarchaeota archaeon]